MATRTASFSRNTLNWRDDALDAPRLAADAGYFAERLQHYREMGADWYVNEHAHACVKCGRVIRHTGLEATRDGDAAHLCCGRDVRQANPFRCE